MLSNMYPNCIRIVLTAYSIVFKLYSNCIQNACNSCSNCNWVVFKLFSNCFKVYSNRIQMVFKPYSNCIQIVFKWYSSCIQMVLKCIQMCIIIPNNIQIWYDFCFWCTKLHFWIWVFWVISFIWAFVSKTASLSHVSNKVPRAKWPHKPKENIMFSVTTTL